MAAMTPTTVAPPQKAVAPPERKIRRIRAHEGPSNRLSGVCERGLKAGLLVHECHSASCKCFCHGCK